MAKPDRRSAVAQVCSEVHMCPSVCREGCAERPRKTTNVESACSPLTTVVEALLAVLARVLAAANTTPTGSSSELKRAASSARGSMAASMHLTPIPPILDRRDARFRTV